MFYDGNYATIFNDCLRLCVTVSAANIGASARLGPATDDPRGYLSVRSSHDLAPGVSTDLMLRRVARLPQPAVPGYHELDACIAWQARPRVELALAGRNVLLAHHPEVGTAGLRQLAERGVFASASLRF
jgi:iron complex outermembrane receptor protein